MLTAVSWLAQVRGMLPPEGPVPQALRDGIVQMLALEKTRSVKRHAQDIAVMAKQRSDADVGGPVHPAGGLNLARSRIVRCDTALVYTLMLCLIRRWCIH